MAKPHRPIWIRVLTGSGCALAVALLAAIGWQTDLLTFSVIKKAGSLLLTSGIVGAVFILILKGRRDARVAEAQRRHLLRGLSDELAHNLDVAQKLPTLKADQTVGYRLVTDFAQKTSDTGARLIRSESLVSEVRKAQAVCERVNGCLDQVSGIYRNPTGPNWMAAMKAARKGYVDGARELAALLPGLIARIGSELGDAP